MVGENSGLAVRLSDDHRMELNYCVNRKMYTLCTYDTREANKEKSRATMAENRTSGSQGNVSTTKK